MQNESQLSGTAYAVITIFPSATATAPVKDTTLTEFVAAIKSRKYEALVEEIRAHARQGNKDRVGWLKRKLPAVTLSCSMTSRSKNASERARTHSGWLQCDFDGKDNYSVDWPAAKTNLMADPHVGAVFVGPSGIGLKAVARIDGAKHLESAIVAANYFQSKYGLSLDPACKDVERLCFVSHDPEAWLSERDCDPLPIPEGFVREAPRKGGQSDLSADMSNNDWTVEDVRELLRYIPPRPDYETWLRITSGVFSLLPFGMAYQVLNEWSPEEKVGEYQDKFRSRLKEITIRTVIHYAQLNGFDAGAAARRKRWCGRVLIGGRVVSGEGGAQTERQRIVEITDRNLPHAPLLEPDARKRDAGNLAGIWERLNCQQLGDAALFLDEVGDDYLYDPFVKAWKVFNPANGLWEKDTAHHTLVAIANTCVEAYGALAETIQSEIEETPFQGKKQEDPRVREIEKIEKRISMLRSAGYAEGVSKFAQRMPGFAVASSQFDRRRNLLALNNGVLDLDAALFKPAERTDMLTMAAPVAFDPDATCPMFDDFLMRAMGGDKDLINYLWRAIGYTLSGYVDHDALFFCYGTGANGKSTFFLTLSMLIGPSLSSVISVANLIGNASDATASYHKASLEGKRLIITDELEADKYLNESTVKALLGGEDIVARRPFEMPYNFSPTHKIWMMGNHKPKIKGTDHGIWRRIHLIPWVVTVPQNERRVRTEMLAEFRTELPGILNRAFVGYSDYVHNGGLRPPKAVLDATNEYRSEEDTLGRFLAESVSESAGSAIAIAELFSSYRDWCEKNGEKPAIPTSNKMTIEMRKLFGERIGHGPGRKSVLLDSTWAG